MSDAWREGWEHVVVAASGPSLTIPVSARILELQANGYKVIAVNDAWRRVPFADAMYACDRGWWDIYGPQVITGFRGEKWTSHSTSKHEDNDKIAWGRLDEFRLQMVTGSPDDGFCLDRPGHIHYGNNSGFQAINLALMWGAWEVRLAGFDMRRVAGLSHFFGEHPPALNVPTNFAAFVKDFERAAALLPPDRRVVCCTPGSALTCFPQEDL